MYKDLLQTTCANAIDFLDALPDRVVAPPVDYTKLVASLGGPLPVDGQPALETIDHLRKAAEPGIVITAGPRYFGFVIGGALPAALAADWLTSTWDQNAFSYLLSPAAAAVEEVARQWLLSLFGLPEGMSLGLTTGATMANFTGLAAARHALLRDLGWNVEEQGLAGSPPMTVVASEESHITVFAAIQMLGLGTKRTVGIPTDDQGRMIASELRAALARIDTPVVVCAQAGNVNTGAFDPLPEIAACLHGRAAWLHVDGAFGLWAAASPELRDRVRGIELANSITTDCHKWLNVPYDSGLIFVRDRAAHHAAMTWMAPYYAIDKETGRNNFMWVPESSRRARGFTVYAAIRNLGSRGIAGMIERCCQLARRMAERLAQDPRVEILNDVVLNQVMVRFKPSSGNDVDGFTAEVMRRIQDDGTCWAGGTTWHGQHAMRISVSNWSTTEADIDVSADAMLRCVG